MDDYNAIGAGFGRALAGPVQRLAAAFDGASAALSGLEGKLPMARVTNAKLTTCHSCETYRVSFLRKQESNATRDLTDSCFRRNDTW